MSPVVHLAWLDGSELATAIAEIAWSEALSVLESVGIEADWRRVQPQEVARAGEIRVIVVDRLVTDGDTKRPILGETSGERRRFPVAWVLLPGVLATLHPSPARAAPPLRERRDIGVAVGRVVAHEVVHVIAPDLPHGRGLMSRALSRSKLTAPRISIEPGVAVAARAALRGAPTAPVGNPGAPAVSRSIATALHADESVP